MNWKTPYCVSPERDIDILTNILIDTGDYQPTFQELKTIAQLYGLDSSTHAGLLTDKRAYYQLRLNPPKTTPPPGLIPTQPPAMHCPKQPFQLDLSFKSIALEGAEEAIVDYAYLNGNYEATLRKINGQWMVDGIKLTHWYGNG